MFVHLQMGAERIEVLKQKDKESEKIPDDLWVQCDFPKCLKWRRLPGGTDPSKLPEMWFCYLHPDPVIAEQSHNYPEEKYDGGRSAENGEEGGFSLKDAKRKFEMHKKVRAGKCAERQHRESDAAASTCHAVDCTGEEAEDRGEGEAEGGGAAREAGASGAGTAQAAAGEGGV